MATQRRNTRQRKLVLDTVRAHNDHPTAEDIYLDVRKVDDKISRGTVYRNLNLLDETGTITIIKTPGGSRFDWRTDHHAHVTCRACGVVADVLTPYDASIDAHAGAETGFAIAHHETMFMGLCPACQQKLHAEEQAS